MNVVLFLVALFALNNIHIVIISAVAFVIALVFFMIWELIDNEKSNNDDGESQ